jgi:hypothetical protein
MVDHFNGKALKNLSLFNVFTTPYKIVNSHAITADVLIPEDLEPGKHPLLVRIYGGGLVSINPLSSKKYI